MQIGENHAGGAGKEFCADGDLTIEVGHLFLIQGVALSGQGLHIVSHLHQTQQLGTSYHLCYARLTMSPDVYSALETCSSWGKFRLMGPGI